MHTGYMSRKQKSPKTTKPVSKILYKGEEGIFKMRRGLETHFKILYIAMVFTGVALVWYGIWKGVQSVPILNHPAVAIVVGLILLVLTGRVNKLK